MGGVDDNVAGVTHARLTGIGWESNKGVDLARGKELGLANRRIGYPIDVGDGVEPDIGGHNAHQQIIDRYSEGRAYAHSFSAQIRDVMDTVVGSQFETPCMDAREHHQWFSGFHPGQIIDSGLHADIGGAVRQHVDPGERYIADFGKTFLVQQFLGQI